MKSSHIIRGIAMGIPLLFLSFTFPVKPAPLVAKMQKIYWDEQASLNWDYFAVKGKDNDDHAAQSNIGIETNTEFNSVGAKITIRASFNKTRSWVKENCVTEYILNHEQRHYDISELFARKLRKQLAEGNFNVHSFASKYNVLYGKIVKEHNEYQDLYDAQSNHSINTDMQEFWNDKIDAELLGLEEYANPTIRISF